VDQVASSVQSAAERVGARSEEWMERQDEMMEQVRGRPAERGGRVPAVAVSAYARHEDTERSLASGFEAHVSKPVDVDELVVIITALAAPGPISIR